jgi:beta-galactosidase
MIFFLVYCLFYSTTQAQQSIRLNNNWQFLKQDIGSIWEAVRPVVKGNPESVPLWTDITLPHCVNAEDAVDPDINYYQGPAWYKTQLSIRNPYSNGRTLLHFEGAGQKTDVYVYTMKVGSHMGGYDEWTVDITHTVDSFSKTETCKNQFKGKIPIAIRCDNSRDPEMIPSSLSDFNIYGGIYRYLNLVYTPSLSIDKLFVLAEVDKEGKQGKINIKTRLYNPGDAGAATVLVKLMDIKGKIIGQTQRQLNNLKGDISIDSFLVRSPKLWSPDDPGLYTVEAIIKNGSDSCIKKEKIGFRNFEFLTKGPFLLNGKRLLLQGTHRHEDHAAVGAAMTEEMQHTEMILIKEMGVNFIRLGHYQQSRNILDLCDSLGILVWEEIPWCRGGIGGDKYQSQARSMLTNMIEQHYNHPSIIIWGLGNENDWPGDFPVYDTAGIKNFIRALNTLSHQLDDSRKTAIRRCDFAKDIPDIYSPSIWAGWYQGVYTEYKERSKREFDRVNHFLHVEWGGDSHARRHSEIPDKILQQFIQTKDTATFIKSIKGAKDGDWNENFACNLIDWHLKEQETMPWLTGTAQWAFKDFSTPLRPDDPVPYVNQKGVVERDFTKKEAYYVFQSYWTAKPMAHIYGHSMPVRWGDEGEEKMVKVYSNCDQAELFVNGKSAGIKNRNSQDFPAAGLHWNGIFKKGFNTVNVIARKNKTIVSDTIRFQYQSEKWGKPAKAIFEKINETNDTATIQVKVVDEKNIQCLDAVNWVRFGLAGDGKLIDNMGTSTGSRYVQLYNGMAIIRVKMNRGKSWVSAKVDAVPVVFINL